jgi:hypothetical protein
MNYEEQVEGVTFYFRSSVITAPARPGDVFSVSLALTCGVQSEELWNDILGRLRSKDGFRVFSSNDFHVEVLNVMQRTVRELEDNKVLLERELQQAKDELARTKEVLASYQVPLSAFGKALRGDDQQGG